MKTEQINAAIKEAERFIKAAKACIAARKQTYTVGDHTFHLSAPKESGSARRASMDLTRALAEMRKQ